MSENTVRVGSREIKLSNLDKILYPAADFAKRDVIHYYAEVSDVILPHLRGRPLTLKRYPQGVTGDFFYEKRCPSYRPPWIHTSKVWAGQKADWISFCTIEDKASLLWVANLASLELHTLLSREPRADRPTAMVFDFDPGAPATLLDCLKVGLRVRDLLHNLGLESFAKTSGGKGLHLWVPLNTPVTFEQTKEFSHALALLFEKQLPELVISKMRKDLRQGKVFVDWSQNDSHKTTACAYTLRARERPSVSTPITWKEAESAVRRHDVTRLTFEAPQVIKRIRSKGDLFKSVLTLKQKIPAGGL